MKKKAKQREESKMGMKKRGRKCKKKGEEGDENDPWSIIPVELKEDILMKMAPKSIARLGLVSKEWSSIIRGKYFTELYQSRSSTQPRLLFAAYRDGTKMQLFHSCSQEDPSSDLRTVSYTTNRDLAYIFSPPIGGLIFGRNGRKVTFGNPSTGQFVSLPNIKAWRKEGISSTGFGYDPVNDLYKVLYMTIPRPGVPFSVSEDHQVLTIGPKQKWRSIDCKYLHRHYPGSQQICRNGVLYYIASFNYKRSLISFDLRSEEFNVIKLPEENKLLRSGKLVNHTGKITIASLPINGPIDLWVLEDASKEEWSKVAAVASSWLALIENTRSMFRGILRTGEIILQPLPTSSKPLSFRCYDPKEKYARKVVIEGIIGDGSAFVQVFFDHVESHMLVSQIR